MDLGSLFLILALFVLVALFVSRPFFEPRGSQSRAPSSALAGADKQEDHEFSALLAERDRILSSLQELDFDNALGKIPEEDYPAQRAALVRNGAEVLRQLDALQRAGNGSASISGAAEEHEARLEAVLASRGMLASSGVYQVDGRRRGPGVPDDALEAKIAARRRARQEKSAGFCPQCGGPVQKSDMFCPKCGAKL